MTSLKVHRDKTIAIYDDRSTRDFSHETSFRNSFAYTSNGDRQTVCIPVIAKRNCTNKRIRRRAYRDSQAAIDVRQPDIERSYSRLALVPT